MRFREYDAPRAHVVADDLLPPAELDAFLERLRALEPRMTVGMVRKRTGFEAADLKENRVLFLDGTERDEDAQAVYGGLRRAVWSPNVLDALEEANEPLFQVLQYTDAPSVQVSRYVASGHYDFHRDVGNKTNLTVLFFACARPQAFTGGNFVLEHRGRRKTVKFKSNRLLIFPSSTLHRVTPVRGGADRFEAARFSLQIWPAIVPGKSRGPRSLHALRREDQARHPKTPTLAVASEDVTGSAAFYDALFGGRELAVEDLQLGAFGRLGGRLLANLSFLARELYPGRDFRRRFQNLPGRPDEVATRFFLTHTDGATQLELGYRVAPGESDAAPLTAALVARVTHAGRTGEGRRTVKLHAGHARLRAQLLHALASALDGARAPAKLRPRTDAT